MFRSLCVAALLASAMADIPANSRLGSRLLSKARLLNNDNNNGEPDYTWVSDYSIRFESCHTTLSFRAEGGNSADGADEAPTESMRLVHFKLCPSTACASSCQNGADYLVEMREFVESYLEFQMTQKEYNCEKVQENCDCQNYNDDQVCLNECYAAAGLDYCVEEDQDNYNNNNQNDFELDRYLECEQINENDGYSTPLYVGAYCSSNHKHIYLGTFSDRQCSQKTSDVSAFTSYTGFELPYQTESLVSNDCISCKEPSEYDDDYNADQYDQDQVVEICEELYQRSAKCEGRLQGVATQYTGGCDFMHKFLPQMERVASGKPSTGNVLAWIFGCTTIALAVVVAYMSKKATRAKVDLSTQG